MLRASKGEVAVRAYQQNRRVFAEDMTELSLVFPYAGDLIPLYKTLPWREQGLQLLVCLLRRGNVGIEKCEPIRNRVGERDSSATHARAGDPGGNLIEHVPKDWIFGADGTSRLQQAFLACLGFRSNCASSRQLVHRLTIYSQTDGRIDGRRNNVYSEVLL